MEDKQKPNDKSLVECVKRLREEAGVSVQDAAKEFGIPESQWVEIEAGGAGVRLKDLWKIATMFNTNVSDFFP